MRFISACAFSNTDTGTHSAITHITCVGYHSKAYNCAEGLHFILEWLISGKTVDYFRKIVDHRKDGLILATYTTVDYYKMVDNFRPTVNCSKDGCLFCFNDSKYFWCLVIMQWLIVVQSGMVWHMHTISWFSWCKLLQCFALGDWKCTFTIGRFLRYTAC